MAERRSILTVEARWAVEGEHTYLLHRCEYVVSKGPRKGMRCRRPTVPTHGRNHCLEEAMMSCPEEDHRRWPDGVCMSCGRSE